MSFQETLKEAVSKVPGATGAMIIGLDGMPVEQFMEETRIDHNEVAAEVSGLFKTLRQTTEDLSLGPLKEIAFQTDQYIFVFRAITEDYFLALILKSNGNFGKARFVLRTLVSKIEKEF